jgi:hypothetical protein
MPRTVNEIIEHADELGRRFEAYEPQPGDERDPKLIRTLRRAAQSRSTAEKNVREAVIAARAGGCSWALIGAELGTSGEAARQRYGSITHQ